MPFIEQNNLYQQFKLDEPWNSPNNIKLLDMVVPLYEPLDPQTKKKPGDTYLHGGGSTWITGSPGS